MSIELNQPIYEVKPIAGPINIQLEVPGSKSITNRALLLAALSEGKSLLKGVLKSDDSRHFLNCLIALGFPVEIREEENIVSITGFGGRIPKKEASVYVGSAGTAARFLTAMLGLSDGIYHMDASPQMKKRPMKPLLDSLAFLGARITYEEQEGCFPFTISGSHISGHAIEIEIGSSSQFLSALLMSAPILKDGLTISIAGGNHSLSYVEITLRMMKDFGCQVQSGGKGVYRIPAGASYRGIHYQIEPDLSAACYFYAMAPLLTGSVLVKHVHPDTMQGDLEFLHVLETLGCRLTDTELGIRLTYEKNTPFPGITVNMGSFSDQTMTLACLAPFASSPTHITHIGHIRLQECDRINAILTELSRLNISCEETDQGILIFPGRPSPCQIETYEDHRIAMAFSLIGLKVPGIQIKNPACCRKTFENYFDLLEQISAEMQS